MPDIESKAYLEKRRTSTPNKHVILVAGYDYSWQDNNPPRPIPFNDYCINRVNRLLEKDPTLTFTIFDVKSGKVKQIQKDKTGKKVESLILIKDQPFRAILDSNYHKKIIRGSEFLVLMETNGIMSIADIHGYIQKFGEQKKGNSLPDNVIIELSFFSHGYPNGPILVNTFKNISPKDLDPRKEHFNDDPNEPDSQYLRGSKKDFLRNAFAENAFVWCWGCSWKKGLFRLIENIVNHTAYKEIKPENRFTEFPKIPKKIRITFGDKKERDETYPSDPDFFPQKVNGEFPVHFDKSGDEIKKFFNKHLEKTYFSVIAKHLKIKCHGAFLGIYADEEARKIPTPKNPLMFIPRGWKNKGEESKPQKDRAFKDDFTRWVDFYTKAIGKKVDPEGFGYGIYDP